MKPFHVVPILLLALGAGAWFLLSPPRDLTPIAAEDESAVAVTPPAAGTLDLPPSPRPSGIENRETVEPVATAAAAAAPVYGTPVPEGEGFLARAVEAESKKAIPFAEILLVDVGNIDEQAIQALMAQLRDVDALIEALAVRYRTGADGTVRLPLPTREVWAAARKDSWFGMAMEQSVPTGGLTIECQLTNAVAARVRDEQGKPQSGIPVDLRFGEAEQSNRVISIVTDEDGVARVRRLELFTRDAPGGQSWSLAIGGYLDTAIAKEFDPANPPAEPLDLTLPPYGQVEVGLTDLRGAPWAEPAVVELSRLIPGEKTEQEGLQTRDQGNIALLEKGSARFLPTGLGMQFRARAMRQDGSLIGEAVGPGPRNAGETAVIAIAEVGGASFVTGRVLGENGKPIAKEKFDFRLESTGPGGSTSMRSLNLRTDAEGSFRFQVDDPVLAAGAHRKLTVRQRARNSSTAAAASDLSWTLPPGETNLGDLRLGMAPLIASGIVVDETGKPVSNAHVVLQEKKSYGAGATEYYWSWIQGGEAFTQADGSFALHAEVDVGEFLVNCMSSDFWCEGVTVTRGATGLRLVLRRGGTITGSLLTDEGIDTSDYLVDLLLPEAEPDPFGRNSVQAGKDGSFSLPNLRPGVYLLRLRAASTGHIYMELAGFVVTAGEVCQDTRLNPLDARGLIHGIRLSVRDADGKPIDSFGVFVIRPSGEMNHFYSHEAELLIPLLDPAADLLVQCDGYLRARLTAVSGDQTVTLLRAPRVRMQVTNPEVVPAGYELMLRLDPAADRDLNAWSDSSATMGADGWAECAAAALGACSVNAVLMLRTESGSRGWGVPTGLGEIEVRDTSAPQTIQITLLEEEIAQTVERLRQQD